MFSFAKFVGKFLFVLMATMAQNADDHQSTSTEVAETEDRKRVNVLSASFSKLNPWAREFVPSSSRSRSNQQSDRRSPVVDQDSGSSSVPNNRRQRRNSSNQGRKRSNGRGERDECVKRTVFVSDIDRQVTEEQLASLFTGCGPIVDCRICGDPHSALRFAFVEFAEDEGAKAALNLSGTALGYYQLKVMPSKTAIHPVDPYYLPRSESEREMCARTVYCTNIDKQVSQPDIKNFFQSTCGQVSRLRLLGDNEHATRIAFVEFNVAECAIAALNCSGMILGSIPIRVSPSKTPVRARPPRP